MVGHCNSFATYNLHGLNNGRSGHLDICNNMETVIFKSSVPLCWMFRREITRLRYIL